MNFYVTFKTSNRGFLYERDYQTVSVPGVKLLRKSAGYDIPLERIETGIGRCYNGSRTLQIEESVAFEVYNNHKYFSDSNELIVIVPEYFCNQFIKPKFYITRKPDTGEITNAYIRNEMDEDALRNWWIGNGYPILVETGKDDDN